ncbi:nitrite/sulfite reductase [uncultured Ilyobacter sp.]|uniref:nitrite/sulfite reductase n=1 Tax=uncultured Ilyobacter sp. TaxID=544433 RepID=UPI0029C00FA1|nr:nitrite/sulfite reductase [uncultured Ilyobacter sp.]
MIFEEKLKSEHLEIKKTLEKYTAGEIKIPDVKKVTTKYGIYNTRDGRFMARVRQVGGEFSLNKIKVIADIMDKNDVSFAHVSTRDSIQLQGVPASRLYEVVRECTENGMPFKGGGGNAYRNPLVSPLSGISNENIFDVRPYAIQTDLFMQGFEKAFDLGRKFKISFSSEAEDYGRTAVNDLGFLAKVIDGQKGFLVYTGGGMGRSPEIGKVLFDFLPANECIRVSAAMIEVFHDHGERTNRSKARLRFLVNQMGFKEFQKLFYEYYNKIEIPEKYKNFFKKNYENLINSLNRSSNKNIQTEDFENWKKSALKESIFKDVFSVRLFIGGGNFSSDDLKNLAFILEKTGCPFVRLTTEQDLYIPLVHKNFLPELYLMIKRDLNNQGAADLKFKDHIVTCIGASLCGIGLLDSQIIGKSISDKIEELFDKYPEYRGDLYTQIIDGVRVSGCSSSCAVNQISPLGFMGVKKMVDGVVTDCLQVFIGGRIDSEMQTLSKTHPDKFVTVEKAPEFVFSLLEAYILKLKNGETLSFKEYMQNYKY